MPNKFGQTVNSNSGRSILRNGSHQRKEEVSTRDLNQAKDLFDKPPKARKNTSDLAYHHCHIVAMVLIRRFLFYSMLA